MKMPFKSRAPGYTSPEWRAIVKAQEKATSICSFCHKKALYRDHLNNGELLAACSLHREKLMGAHARSYGDGEP